MVEHISLKRLVAEAGRSGELEGEKLLAACRWGQRSKGVLVTGTPLMRVSTTGCGQLRVMAGVVGMPLNGQQL